MTKPFVVMRQSGKLRLEVTTYPRFPMQPEELGGMFDVYGYYPLMIDDRGICDFWSRDYTQDPKGEGTPYSSSEPFWTRMGYMAASLVTEGAPGQVCEFVWRGPEKTYYYKLMRVEG